MLMYNLREYTDIYSKASGILWQCYKVEPNDKLADSESFKSTIKITGITTSDGGTKNDEIMVPLKYSSNSRRTIETH